MASMEALDAPGGYHVWITGPTPRRRGSSRAVWIDWDYEGDTRRGEVVWDIC